METAFCAGINIRHIIDSLPNEEAQHMCRVGMLVDVLAQKLCGNGIEYRAKCKYYGEAASYHDIGKAWIPKNILIKPDKLTSKEAMIMRRHPVFAQALFDRMRTGSILVMPKYLVEPAMNSAVYHHERWDGTGYPYGLERDASPLVARLTSICDAYDAMTSNRVYQNAHTHHYACNSLDANSGSQFDPSLVRIFLDHEHEFSVLARGMFLNQSAYADKNVK